MNSLSNMKVQIVELEDRKKNLETEINKAGKQYKLGLWVVLAGILLLPLYGVGLLPLAAGGIYALIHANKRAKYRNELENLDAKIHRLNLSMA